MGSKPTKSWIGAALGVNLILAAIILVARGADADGTKLALRATARVSFLWFWVAYAGGALATLFGPAFLPLKHRAREFGLAFAAALLVHLMLVGWLCWIGSAPGRGVFILFGTAAGITLILAVFSFGNLHEMLGLKCWQFFRLLGMNFILYAFLSDFMRVPINGDVRYLAAYLPFVVMAIVAPFLRLAVWGTRLRFPKHSIR
jgi:hypothetical protein